MGSGPLQPANSAVKTKYFKKCFKDLPLFLNSAPDFHNEDRYFNANYMPLSTTVKVGNISNLSDARYCAGMGVEMLGFSVIEGQRHYVSPKLFQEIRGWVSGPAVVAEIYGIQSKEQLADIVENYQPDFFELDENEFNRFGSLLGKPCIISVDNADTASADSSVGYYIVDEALIASLRDQSFTRPVLVRASTAHQALQILSMYPVSGLALSGTPEERPGYKDYDQLSSILEQLEED